MVAGTGATGNTGDGGPATEALLGGPEGLAVDDQGNVYIGTMDLCLVRKVSRTTGIISTVAGSLTLGCGYNGDREIATQTQLATIRKIAIDKAGNLLVPDGGNNVVWKVDLRRNTIARIAGRPGVSGYTGDGGSALNATFASSRGVDTDPWGNIYVVDRGNNVIRKIDRSGIITTVAGTGTAGYSDNPTDARQGMLNSPTDVSVDLDGQLYIADYFNRVIRRVAFNPAIESIFPTTGPVGTKVLIKGKYFATYWGASTIRLGALTIPAADAPLRGASHLFTYTGVLVLVGE